MVTQEMNCSEKKPDDVVDETPQTKGLTYTDDEGNLREEPPCEQCLRHFKWTPERRFIIDTAIEFHLAAEEYEVLVWHALTEQYGSSDYQGQAGVSALQEAIASSSGLFALDVWHIRALRGSIHIALAANILANETNEKAMEILDWLDKFSTHLHNCHRDGMAMRLPHRTLDDMRKPKYLGDFGVQRAWRFAPRLAGKSVNDAIEVFRADFHGMLTRIRNELAKWHGGRSSQCFVLEKGLQKAVATIEGNIEDWLKRAKESDSCADLLYLSSQIHDEIFLIDELMAMGCSLYEPEDIYSGADTFFRTIERIEHLIDWDECPTLADWMDRARKSRKSVDGNKNDGDFLGTANVPA